MENYIDWNDSSASKSQGDAQHQNLGTATSQPSPLQWHNATNSNNAPLQNPYNVDVAHKAPEKGRQVSDYGQQSYTPTYSTGNMMSPSLSSSATNPQHQYMYPMMPMQRNSSQQSYPSGGAQNTASHLLDTSSHLGSYPQQSVQTNSYPNPYSYANGANPYNIYNTPVQSHQNYYNNHAMHNSHAGTSNGQYPAQGAQNSHSLPRSMSPQVQYQYHYQQNTNPQYQPQFQQYQRPEDALNRVQQSWPGGKVAPSSQPTNGNPQYMTWQGNNMQTGQTVYYDMNARPVMSPAKSVVRAALPSSPPRPDDPLAALRYDVSHCLNEYNTSRDLKGCAAALLAIMTTCDPLVPPVDSAIPPQSAKDNTAPERSSTSNITKEELDPKIKQTALLSVVCSDIKGAMVEEVSKNKSIRAKLRTWFVRAHKDSSYVVLKALIKVMDKLTFLSAQELAEVKFGKAIMIVSRKCEDKEVKDALAHWVGKAEDSLPIERELEIAASKAPPIEDGPKKKVKLSSTPAAGNKVVGKAGSPALRSDPSIKKIEDKPKAMIPKKNEPVAKTNAAFFKKEVTPMVKPIIAKPGMAAALAGIKARKKIEGEKPANDNEVKSAKITITTVPKVLPSGKSSFSALKLVEGLKRTASPVVPTDNEPDAKRQKKKKRVSWRPDPELEQIQIFETLEPEDGVYDVANTPHEYGNARDLDRKEGALLHGGVLPDRDEDFLDWEFPAPIDFSSSVLAGASDSHGPKRAGTLRIRSRVTDAETERESLTPSTTYTSEFDIPWSSVETNVNNSSSAEEAARPRIIPLPTELRDDWRVKQVLGDLVNPPREDYAQMQAQATQSATVAKSPIESPASAAGPLDIAAILAGIIQASQQANPQSTGTGPGTDPPVEVGGVVDGNKLLQVGGTNGEAPIRVSPAPPAAAAALGSTATASLPATMDTKLAEFLASLASGNGGLPPPPPVMLAQRTEQEAPLNNNVVSSSNAGAADVPP